MQTIHLQGIGSVNAIPAAQLKEGMITIWNYGFKETIQKITPSKTGKSINVKILSHSDNKEYNRKLFINRLVAIVIPVK